MAEQIKREDIAEVGVLDNIIPTSEQIKMYRELNDLILKTAENLKEFKITGDSVLETMVRTSAQQEKTTKVYEAKIVVDEKLNSLEKEIIPTLKEQDDSWRAMTATMQENSKFLVESRQELKKVQKEIKLLNKELELKPKFGKDLENVNKKLAELTIRETEIKTAISQANIMLKTQTKETQAVEGSMDKANQTLGQMRKLWRQMTDEEKSSDWGQNLLEQIQNLDAGLKSADGQIGNFHRNVGNYTGAVSNAFSNTRIFVPTLGRLAGSFGGAGKQIQTLIGGMNGLSTSLRSVSMAFKAMPIIGWTVLIGEAIGWITRLTTATNDQTEAQKESNDELKRENELRKQQQKQLDVDHQVRKRMNLSQEELKILQNKIKTNRDNLIQERLQLRTANQRLENAKKLDDILSGGLKSQRKKDIENLDLSIEKQNELLEMNNAMFGFNEIAVKDYIEEINESGKSVEDLTKEIEKMDNHLKLVSPLIVEETKETKNSTKEIRDQTNALNALKKARRDVWMAGFQDEELELMAEMERLVNELKKVGEASEILGITVDSDLVAKMVEQSLIRENEIREKYRLKREQEENEAREKEFNERIAHADRVRKENEINLLKLNLTQEDYNERNLEITEKHLNEIKKIREEYGKDTIDQERELLALRHSLIDEPQDESIDIFKAYQKTEENITKVVEDNANKRIEMTKNEMNARKQMVDYLSGLAKEGNITAQQSLKEEIEAQREAEKKLADIERRKAMYKTIQAGLSSFIASIEKGKSGAGALAETTGTVAVLENFLKNVDFFASGTKNAPAGLAIVDEKGAELHTDKFGNIKNFGSDEGANFRMLERGDNIFTALETKKIMDEFTKIPLPKKRDYAGNSYDLLTLKELQNISKKIENQEKTSTYFDEFAGELIRATTNGNSRIIKRYKVK